jgi:hypothetical protein
MTRTRVLVVVMTLLALACAVGVAAQGVILIRDGRAVPVLFGTALMVLPLVGAFTVVAELRFGAASEQLARRLAAEGGLPVDDLPRTASGRVVRAAADADFDRWESQTRAAPGDWRAWYRLALAYDAARDRRRARAATRRAIALARRRRAPRAARPAVDRSPGARPRHAPPQHARPRDQGRRDESRRDQGRRDQGRHDGQRMGLTGSRTPAGPGWGGSGWSGSERRRVDLGGPVWGGPDRRRADVERP